MTSVGQIHVILTSHPSLVTVYLVTGDTLTPCPPLTSSADTGDRYTASTNCRGMSGECVLVRDEREEEEYFGVCEVEVFRYQEILSCGTPDTPPHSSVQVSGYTARYSCRPGYNHVGPHLSHCTEHGWDGGQVPSCEQLTCPPPPPTDHGYIHISPYTGVYSVGTVAVYRCSHGFIVWGEERRVCTDQGWSGSLPQCRKLQCPDPPHIDHSHVTLQENNIALYTCIPGYSDTGHNTSAESVCDERGEWSPADLSCGQSSGRSSFQFGQDPRKDFLIIIIICIFIIIILVSAALASRLIIRRINKKRGFFLRHPHHKYQEPVQPTEENQQKPLPINEKLIQSKPTPKKVSLILKIENDSSVSKTVVKNKNITSNPSHNPTLAALKHHDHDQGGSADTVAQRQAGVELCVLSHSYSSIPLPESCVSLDTCVPGDAVTKFATLSRRSSSRHKTDSRLRHSRSFSTFHPVPIPKINISDYH